MLLRERLGRRARAPARPAIDREPHNRLVLLVERYLPNRAGVALTVLMLLALGTLSAMTYAPVAAAMVELFPSRIRYTAMSLPYHAGNGWIGGLLPPMAFAMVAASGSVYAGLWYPLAFALLTVVVGTLMLPETRGTDIDADEAAAGR